MALIAKQFSSRIAVATTKESSWKIAEINFDSLDPVIDHILKDGITFENDAVKLLSCRALDPVVPLVRLRLSNLPFLKEDFYPPNPNSPTARESSPKGNRYI